MQRQCFHSQMGHDMRLCTHLVEYKEGDFSKCHHIRLLPLRCWRWNRAAATRQQPLQLVYLVVSYLAVEDSARLCHMGTVSPEVVSCRPWTYDMIGSQITTAAEIKLSPTMTGGLCRHTDNCTTHLVVRLWNTTCQTTPWLYGAHHQPTLKLLTFEVVV